MNDGWKKDLGKISKQINGDAQSDISLTDAIASITALPLPTYIKDKIMDDRLVIQNLVSSVERLQHRSENTGYYIQEMRDFDETVDLGEIESIHRDVESDLEEIKSKMELLRQELVRCNEEGISAEGKNRPILIAELMNIIRPQIFALGGDAMNVTLALDEAKAQERNIDRIMDERHQLLDQEDQRKFEIVDDFKSRNADVMELLESDLLPLCSMDEEVEAVRDGMERFSIVSRTFDTFEVSELTSFINELSRSINEIRIAVRKKENYLNRLLDYSGRLEDARGLLDKVQKIAGDPRFLSMLSGDKRAQFHELRKTLMDFVVLLDANAANEVEARKCASKSDDYIDDVLGRLESLNNTVKWAGTSDEPGIKNYWDLYNACLALWNNPPFCVEKDSDRSLNRKKFYSIWCGPADNRAPILMRDGDEVKFPQCARLNDPLEMTSLPVPSSIQNSMLDISDGEFCTRDGAKLPQDLSGYVKNAFHLILTGDQILPSPKNKGGFKVKKNRNMDGDGESLKPRTQGQVVLASMHPDAVTDGKLLGSGGHYKAYVFGNKTVVEFDQEAHGTYFFDTDYFVDLKAWSRSEILAERPEGFHRRIIHPQGQWESWREKVEEFITAP